MLFGVHIENTNGRRELARQPLHFANRPGERLRGGAERVRMSILPIARLEPLRLASGTAGTTARCDRQKRPHPVSSCVCPRRTLLWHRWKLFPINKPVGPQVKAASPAFRV